MAYEQHTRRLAHRVIERISKMYRGAYIISAHNALVAVAAVAGRSPFNAEPKTSHLQLRLARSGSSVYPANFGSPWVVLNLNLPSILAKVLKKSA